MTHPPAPVLHTGDAASVGVLLATIEGWLPHIATLLTVVWMVIRIIVEWPSLMDRVKSWQKK